METIKVIILPSGEAREVNPMGETYPRTFLKRLKWEVIDNKLRTFTIENVIAIPRDGSGRVITTAGYISPGSEYSAEILDNGKIRII